MSYFQITEDDYNNLKKKLEEVLGEGYEVETHKEVSALMGAIREAFDLVGFSLSIYPSFRLQNYHYFPIIQLFSELYMLKTVNIKLFR